jgi:peptidoglycan/LPS O-acetylase OafA/YrhL
MIILHRFLRLAPLYFATILFFWQIMSMAGNGPVFFMYKDEYAGACNKYWWSHLLFINNFYPFGEDEQCLGWTWYLPNDMQFFLLLPPLVWLCYRYRVIGMLSILTIMVGCWIASFVILYINDFSPSMKETKENYFRVFYMKPYMRIAPFFIGIYLGLFIYSFRNDEPELSLIKRI